MKKKFKIGFFLLLWTIYLLAIITLTGVLNENKKTIYSSIDSTKVYYLYNVDVFYSIAEDQKTVNILIPFEEKISKNQEFLNFTIPLKSNYYKNIIDGKFGFDLQVYYNTLTKNTYNYYRFYIQRKVNKKVHLQPLIKKKEGLII